MSFWVGNSRLMGRLAWWLSVLAIAVSFLVALGHGAFKEAYFLADELYVGTLFEDVLAWGGNLWDWRLTPAPYFFPDMPLFALARFLTSSLEWRQYVAGFLLLLSVVWAAAALAQETVGVSGDLARRVVGPWFVFCTWLYLHDALPRLAGVARLTGHGGAALCALWSLTLWLRAARSGLCLSVLGILALLAGVSDPLFSGSCGGATLVMTFWLLAPAHLDRVLRLDSRERSSLAKGGFICAVGSLIGALLARKLEEAGSGAPKPLPQLNGTALQAMVHDLLGDASADGWQLLSGVVLAVGLVGWSRTAATPKLRVFACWHLACVAVTACAIALEGYAARYTIVPFVSGLVLMGCTLVFLLARAMPAPPPAQLRDIASGAVLVMLIAMILGGLPAIRAGNYASRWREVATCVLDVARREETTTVLTGYWVAKPLMLFSHGQLTALQMRSKLRRPYFWINSRSWYRSPHRLSVIVGEELQPEVIRVEQGEPATVERCSDLTLFVYRGQAQIKMERYVKRKIDRFMPLPP